MKYRLQNNEPDLQTRIQHKLVLIFMPGLSLLFKAVHWKYGYGDYLSIICLYGYCMIIVYILIYIFMEIYLMPLISVLLPFTDCTSTMFTYPEGPLNLICVKSIYQSIAFMPLA